MSDQYQFNRGGRGRGRGRGHGRGNGGGDGDGGFHQQHFRPQYAAGDGDDGFRGSRGGGNRDGSNGGPDRGRGGHPIARDGRGSYDNSHGRGGDYVGRGGRGSYDRGRGGRGSYVGGSPSAIPDLHQASSSWNRTPRQHRQVTDGMSALSITDPSESSSVRFTEAQLEASLSIGSVKFPARPAQQGRIGYICRVKTNHFLIRLDQSLQSIYHYNVTIEPETKTMIQNRQVMNELHELYKQSELGNMRCLAYDGQKSFYTASRLPFESKEFKVTVLTLNGFKKEYTVGINLVATIDRCNVLAPELIQALDIVMRQTPGSIYTQVRRSFCSPRFGSRALGGGLEAWLGFYQSVRPTQMGFSLNFDVSTAVFVQNLTLVEFVSQILHLKETANRPFSNTDYYKLKKALKGLKVEVTHRGNIRAKYIISGLTTEPTGRLIFPSREGGKDKYVVQYFRDAYKLDLQYTSWPCLLVGNKAEKIYMPIEVCKIVGGQKYNRGLDQVQTKNLVRLNSQKPQKREQDILNMVCGNNYPQDDFLNEFGMKIDENPTMVQARNLPAPQINYDHVFQPEGGQWNMMKKKFFSGATVNFWTCINFASTVRDDRARSFCSELADMCNTQGMKFRREPVLPPFSSRPQQAEIALQTLLETISRQKPHVKELELLIVILPDNNGSLYGDVKRICETKLGIITQCVLADTVNVKTATQRGKGVLGNFPSKINAKVGGTNMVIQDPLPNIDDKPTIIFGADVTHPKPGEDSTPSIAAVVASIDWPNVSKYIPSYSAQVGRKEIIQNLDGMVKEHLHSFVQFNKRKPERIIFYRDGVSEGQFAQVLEYELDAIQKAWSGEFNDSRVPPITFVVVQKRHHTRFFPDDTNGRQLADRSGNVIPGTLVDTKICHPSQFDFYLCSHAGIQGTSRPAHYHVLWDENNFSADEIQTLSNNLCYMYSRCTRSVSYPTPTYYAHHVAFRARLYMANDELSDGSSVSRDNAEIPIRQVPRLCEKLKNCQIYC